MRILLTLVAVAAIGALTASIVHVVRDHDDRGAVVYRTVEGADGGSVPSGEGTVILVDHDRAWRGPFFLFPLLLILLLVAFAARRLYWGGGGPGGRHADRLDEWHRSAHASRGDALGARTAGPPDAAEDGGAAGGAAS